jgi:RNA polymerase sigma-70 factor (ECF subfamily)
MRSATDHTELTDVITRWHARMVAAAARVLHDDDEARDAVQDAYLQAVRHLDRFDRRARLSTWLHRVVVNAALMRLRARRRRPVEPLDTTALVDDSASVEAAVERRQMQALVRRSLANVPGAHRAVLVLRDIEEHEPAEVARTLGVTRGALKIRAHRARKALRAELIQIGVASQPARTAGSGATAGTPRISAQRSRGIASATSTTRGSSWRPASAWMMASASASGRAAR